MGLVDGFDQDAEAVQKSFHEFFTLSLFAVQRKSAYSTDQVLLLQCVEQYQLQLPPDLELNHGICKFFERRKNVVW